MTDNEQEERKKFFTEHGIPQQAFDPTKAGPCVRCGIVAEGAADSALYINGKDVIGPICNECHELSCMDFRKFIAEFEKPGSSQ